MSDRLRRLAVVVLGAMSLGFLDPWTNARQANRLYAEGKFDEATTKYNEALVDHPDSALLHFNLGDALFRQGKYDEALAAFAAVPTGDDDPARTARVAYNVGNTKVRLGEAAEGSEPQKALGLYAEAVASYRRALGAAPDDMDAKFNHEYVQKKIADLQKKLEEQRKQQEQNQQSQENQQQEQPQDQNQQQDQAQQNQEQQQPQDQGQQEQQAGQDQQQQQQQQPSQEQQEQQADGGGAGEAKDGEMSRQEAAALLDAQRGEEVQPDEMAKRLQGAVEAEPAEDW